ncbi:hypothetical protein ACP4OV_018221 [Aristida adscensionis]
MCVVLMCLAVALPANEVVVHGATTGNSGRLLHIPSAPSLSHCPSRCAVPPRLLLGSSTIQITYIDDDDFNWLPTSAIRINNIRTPGVGTYRGFWEAPVKGFNIEQGNSLYVVGCDVDIYLFSSNTTDHLIGSCTSTCVDMHNSDVEGYCQGNNGCCYISLPWTLEAFQFKLVRRNSTVAEPDQVNPNVKLFITNDYDFYTRDLYLSWVNSSNIRSGPYLVAPIMDQPNCASAKINKHSYACSDESICTDLLTTKGYYCWCDSLMSGNPYIRNGCIDLFVHRHAVYNLEAKQNCTRSCGNLNIPFPFGIDEGCFANKNFRLNCTPSKVAVLDRRYAQYRVANISLEDGFMHVSNMFDFTSSTKGMETLFVNETDSTMESIYEDPFDFSEEDDIIISWVIANLTCQRAMLMKDTYACLSKNSDCQNITRIGENM